ncbi:hypothetical protein LTS15_009150 [Exophiala xenobiotica]|nr:hypothetical protein LTS15_009150 [Exophiala xenobiotica]
MEQQGDPGIHEQEIGRALRKTNWNWTGINVFDGNAAPVNLLNLAGFVPNPMPKAPGGLHDYDILWDIRENDDAGKMAKVRVQDLTNGTRFTLYSTDASIRLTHRDEGGVITSIHFTTARSSPNPDRYQHCARS